MGIRGLSVTGRVAILRHLPRDALQGHLLVFKTIDKNSLQLSLEAWMPVGSRAVARQAFLCDNSCLNVIDARTQPIMVIISRGWVDHVVKPSPYFQ